MQLGPSLTNTLQPRRNLLSDGLKVQSTPLAKSDRDAALGLASLGIHAAAPHQKELVSKIISLRPCDLQYTQTSVCTRF